MRFTTQRERGTSAAPFPVYNLTYSPRVHCSDGTAPRFSLAQPRDLPGWLIVGIDSTTYVPDARAERNRRGATLPRTKSPPARPVVVQSPRIYVTVIVGVAFWCPALTYKPLALGAGVEIPPPPHCFSEESV